MAADVLQTTPLAIRHRELHALMAPFGGWDMPIQYEGIIAEHGWCRTNAALFDICHMGEFSFRGDFAASGLDEVFSSPVSAIPVGRSRYGFLLNSEGGIIDDLIIFRLAEQEVMIVVNAATAGNDFQVIQERLRGGEFTDITPVTGKLDLQGPLSRQVLRKLVGDELDRLPYFRFATMSLLGGEALVSRTGYTGELGYEIFLPAEKTGELWDELLKDELVKPAGLGARDILRLEVGYSLYGNDIDETVSPLEAGLEAFVAWDRPFFGKEGLLQRKQQGIARQKVAFKVNSRRTPRHGFEIYIGEQAVGEVTSGVFSPMLGCGIGLGFVPPEYVTVGTAITIRHNTTTMGAEVCPLPFYSSTSLRS